MSVYTPHKKKAHTATRLKYILLTRTLENAVHTHLQEYTILTIRNCIPFFCEEGTIYFNTEKKITNYHNRGDTFVTNFLVVCGIVERPCMQGHATGS